MSWFDIESDIETDFPSSDKDSVGRREVCFLHYNGLASPAYLHVSGYRIDENKKSHRLYGLWL